jgi:hypothetical protein
VALHPRQRSVIAAAVFCLVYALVLWPIVPRLSRRQPRLAERYPPSFQPWKVATIRDHLHDRRDDSRHRVIDSVASI